MSSEYWTPENETWKPIEMRKSRFGQFRVLACECDHRTTCRPCFEDHMARVEEELRDVVSN